MNSFAETLHWRVKHNENNIILRIYVCNWVASNPGTPVTRQRVTVTSTERWKTVSNPRQDNTKAVNCTKIRDLHMNKSHKRQRNIQRVLWLIQIARQRHIKRLKDLHVVFCVLQWYQTMSDGITCIHFSTVRQRLTINRRKYCCTRSTLSCSKPSRL